MKTSRIAAAVLVAFLSSTVAAPAFAEDDPTTTQARARFKEGVDFYDKGQFENARLAFLQAYTLKKHPAVLLNLAQSSTKSGHPLEAAKYFQQFLKESSNLSPQQQHDAETGLADARQKLGRVEIVAPPGTDITLDEKEHLGTTPFREPIDVEPGPHSFKSSTETIRVTPAAGQKVQATFGTQTTAPVVAAAPLPAVPAAEPVTAPAPTEAAPPANYPVETKKKSIFDRPANMTPVYAGLAVGGVGLVSTVVFAIFRADAQSDADTVAGQIRTAARTSNVETTGLCNSPANRARFGNACTTLKDNNDKVDTNATIANISAVVMAAGFLTAGGWYLFAPKRGEVHQESGRSAKSAPVQVLPYGGWGQGGLTVAGAF